MKEQTLKQYIATLKVLNEVTGKQHHIKGMMNGEVKFEVTK